MTNDGANSLTYDGGDHLVSNTAAGTTTTYAYDWNGLRVQKVSDGTTTVYIFSGAKLIAEYVNGAAPANPAREYTYAVEQLLATIEGGTTKYHHIDQLSPRLSTDSLGNSLRTFAHYPFGETWYETGTADQWKFTTYGRDSESGNDYAMARIYLNRLARFSSTDPVPAGLANPQRFNRYLYVLNDPLNLIDPLGLQDGTLYWYTNRDGQSTGYAFIYATSTCWTCVGSGLSGFGAPRQDPESRVEKQTHRASALADALNGIGIQSLNPETCGGGWFVLRGIQGDLGPGHYGAFVLVTQDSRSGTYVGYLVEAGYGPVSVGREGSVNPSSGEVESSNLLFVGAGDHLGGFAGYSDRSSPIQLGGYATWGSLRELCPGRRMP